MWPFTGKRIFGNRWWALAFVVFVCWQAADFAGSASGPANANDAVGNLDNIESIGGVLGNS